MTNAPKGRKITAWAAQSARAYSSAPVWLLRLVEMGMVVALVQLTAACGTGEGVNGGGSGDAATPEDNGEANAVADETTGGTIDETVTPPQGYYDALLRRRLEKLDQQTFALLDAPHILWVNFDGATVAKGFDDGESFIVCDKTATIPASGLSPADRDQILAMVQAFYDKANAKLTVTGEQPATSTVFSTMHVGGSYRDLGCLGGAGVLGIAPFDVGNANDADIGFAFVPGSISARTIAETIAHEAGHSYGLDHVQGVTDVMHASATDNIEGFLKSKLRSGALQDGPAVLQAVLGAGIGAPGAPSVPTTATTPVPALPGATAIPGLGNLPIDLANLPGLGQIAGLGSLIPGLAGGTGGVLDISTLLPQLQALIPLAGGLGGITGAIPGGITGAIPGLGGIAGGGTFPGLDQILTIVGVASQAGGGAGTVPFAPGAAAGILGSLTGGGVGGVPLDLSALIGMAGFGSTGGAVSSLQPLLTSLIGGFAGGAIPGIGGAAVPGAAVGGLPVGVPTTIPDLSALLGLAGANGNPADLLANLTGSAAVVNANYTGQTQDALLSLLTVAYGQSYAGMTGLVP